MKPKHSIEEGRKFLDPIMEKNGFHLEFIDEGEGSGGLFCQASYIKKNMSLSFSFRFNLGGVEYTIGDTAISHSDFAKGLGIKAEYPGFSDNPIDGFVRLSSDLQTFGDKFFVGTEESLKRIQAIADQNTTTGFGAIWKE